MDRAVHLEDRRLAMKVSWRAAVGPLSVLGLLVAGLWNLSAPPLWWDEGWTLSLARNWVERGF